MHGEISVKLWHFAKVTSFRCHFKAKYGLNVQENQPLDISMDWLSPRSCVKTLYMPGQGEPQLVSASDRPSCDLLMLLGVEQCTLVMMMVIIMVINFSPNKLAPKTHDLKHFQFLKQNCTNAVEISFVQDNYVECMAHSTL